MKTSELLKAAEKWLWDGTSSTCSGRLPTLCTAIRIAADEITGHASSAHHVCRLIDERLDGAATYSHWAVLHGHLPRDWRRRYGFWQPVIQANRLNWLRELQREFREKGD